jgi:predicted MFS family arabinose efflux permease
VQIPIRVYALFRPSVSVGLMLAVGFSTFALMATPFLLDLVAEHYGISLTEASLIGVLQLGGFMTGSWGAGRFLRPRRRVFVVTLVLAVLANLGSVALPPFPLLLALRVMSGLSLGLISWFGWVQVFGDEQRMGEVAVLGPITGIVASPIIAAVAIGGGASAIFGLLAGLAAIPLLFNRGSGAADRVPPRRDRSRAVPAAMAILLALGLFTLGGSAVFQYAVVLGRGRAGLAPETVALVFSANSLVGIPASRWTGRRGLPGPWLMLTGMCAVVLGLATGPLVFAGAIVCWGFAFWMGVPGVFTVLAERSAHPSDRAGDAQAVMAGGRVIGPFLGGALLDGLGPAALGIVGGSAMATAGLIVFLMRTTVAPRTDQVTGTTA